MPEDLSRLKQPDTLVADLKAIQEGSLEDRFRALADKSLRDPVFVEGGTFPMGDFGRLQSEEGLPWDGNSDSSPLHEVTLDGYSISKYKVTLAESARADAQADGCGCQHAELAVDVVNLELPGGIGSPGQSAPSSYPAGGVPPSRCSTKKSQRRRVM
jgi:formylglycine-generating enzyme required for sulfatase activity